MCKRWVQRTLLAFWLTMACAASAQVLVKGQFTGGAPEAGWKIDETALLTGGRYDPANNGWLWLVDARDSSKSAVFNNVQFSVANGLVVDFEFTIWGGGPTGGDGMSLFLFDATQDMGQAKNAEGLGYCNGAGGWLGLALDATGQFSKASDACAGGPGVTPKALAIRGPIDQKNPFIASAPLGAALAQNMAKQRPNAHRIRMTLTPNSGTEGFRLNVRVIDPTTLQVVHALSDVPFPYPAPALLRLGLAASTQGNANVHEIRRLAVWTPSQAPTTTVTARFNPPTVPQADSSNLVVTLRTQGETPYALKEDTRLPIGTHLKISEPAELGGTCLGTVYADTTNNAIVLAAGNEMRVGSCTVEVRVNPTQTGNLAVRLPETLVRSDEDVPTLPTTATLVVTP